MKTWMPLEYHEKTSGPISNRRTSAGIVFPLSWTLMQMIRSSGSVDLSSIREMLPGLIAMSVLFGTTSMLAVTITFERRGRSFDRLLLAPISLRAMVTAKLSGAVLFGALNAFVPVILAAWFVDLSEVNWVSVLLAVFLTALTSALMGLVIAVSAKEVFEAQTLSTSSASPCCFCAGCSCLSAACRLLSPYPICSHSPMEQICSTVRSLVLAQCRPCCALPYCSCSPFCCLSSANTVSVENGFCKRRRTSQQPGAFSVHTVCSSRSHCEKV